MGARPSSFKKGGGGFLNNVDGTIVSLVFTTEHPGGGNAKAKKNSDFTSLFGLLTVTVDGNEDEQTTSLWGGSADDFEISDDGTSLTPVEDGAGIGANTPLGKFINSLCEKGFPEGNLPDDDEPICYDAIAGTRVRFVQVVDEEATKKLGKKVDKKTKKEYDRKDLMIAAVYSLPGQKGSKAPASKPAAGGAKGAKGGKKGEPDLQAVAVEALIEILNDNDGKIAKSKLPVKIAQKFPVKHPHREELRKLMYSDDFLGLEEGWTYDADSKQQMIELAE